MIFSSIPFLYYFLPVMLLLYALAGRRFRNVVLLLASLFFYGWGEPRYVALMLAAIVFGYGMGIVLGRLRGRVQAAMLACAVTVCVVTLGYFKYADFLIRNINVLTGGSFPLLRVALPVGISFYTFQTISYLADICRGDIKPQRNIVSYGAYISMFPQLIAGPIVRYQTIARSLESRRIGLADIAYGVRRFLIGLSKKILLADTLGELCIRFLSTSDCSVLFCWLYAAAFTLQIYLDFSGYSDMAIGLGRMLGFTFVENFRYPYISSSVTEFWRRWHISLGSWFRDYVYIPLGGNRVSVLRWMRNIAIVWCLTGFWHGASWNFVIWGLYFACFLVIEKAAGKRRRRLEAPNPCRTVLGHLYVLLVVMVGFVIFDGDGLAQAGAHLAGMFGLGGLPVSSPESRYYLCSFGVTLLISAVASTPLPVRMVRRMQSRIWGRRMLNVLEPVALVLLLLLCTASMVDGSFHPFLYFRF